MAFEFVHSRDAFPSGIDEHLLIIGNFEDSSGVIEYVPPGLFVTFAAGDRTYEPKFALDCLDETYVLKTSFGINRQWE